MDKNWNIIPIYKGQDKSNQKRPLIKWKPYITKRFPVEELKKYEPCNYAVICGNISNNLVIFDLDYKDDNKKYFTEIFGKFIEKYPALAKTYITETPHGHHFWYYVKNRCPTRHPRQDTEKSTIIKHLKNKKNPSLIKVTNFPKLLKGVDILGTNGYALIPPSEVLDGKYKPMNNLPVKAISRPVFDKLQNFFLKEEPYKKKMRKPFFDLLVGNIEIEEQAQVTGQSEHVYWKYLYIEAFHRFELEPSDIFPFLKESQPSFDLDKTLTQLQYVNLNDKPMTNEKLQEYFPSATIVTKKKEDKKDEEPLYVTIGSYLLSKYNIVTMDDSEEMLIRKGNVFFEDLNDFYSDLADEIVFYNKSITHMKNSVITWIKLKTRFSRDNFCYDGWLINFQNGYYDIRTKTFYTHNDYKDKLFCYEIPHEYNNEEANCPKFKKILKQWLGSNNKVTIDDVFEMIGYSMTMNTDMKLAFFIFGPSHAGKTQFQTVLEHVIGHHNRSNTSLQRMNKNEFGTHGMAFKILNMVGDMSNLQVSDVSAFKTMTGGDEYLRAEPKSKSAYQFRNITKIWYNGNFIPSLQQDDQAFYNRWVLIHFPNKFPMFDKDTVKNIGKILSEDPDEMKGILCEAIKGVRRLYERRWFRREIIRNTKHIWKYNAEPIYAFLSDMTLYDEEGEIECIELRNKLNKYFIKRGLQPMTAYRLNKEMERYNIFHMRETTGERREVYMGIKWKPQPKISDF